MQPDQLIDRLKKHEAIIGVVGLGYVGLPLVLTYGSKGFRVVGFDIDPEKVEMLTRGESYIRHISGEEIGRAVEEKKFSPTTDYARIAECDVVLLCVPTPLNKNREPNMRYIESTAGSIGPYLKEGMLVVLESTTYPGTTDELLRGILEEKSNLQAGEDFFLAFSPEREDPGNPKWNTQSIPKIVGGLTPACQKAAVAVYEAALDQVVPVSSTRVAEMSKLLENIFRSVNIALVNELKVVCDEMDIDIWEVVEAAATKPFGFMPFYPGPGLGGHCIPIDPFYLTWKAREYDVRTRFIELAGEVNTYMPHYVVERTARALNTNRKALNGSQVLILGAAYKPDVDDVRESPALKIIDLLRERGAVIRYHDPFIPKLRPTRHHSIELESVPLNAKLLAEIDAVVIVTNHANVDYKLVVEHAPLVVDTRNATAGLPQEKVFKA